MNKFYKHGNFREIGYKNPKTSGFSRNIFKNPDDAVDECIVLNDKGNHVYMSVFGYHESVPSSKDMVDNNIVFDRLVYDFDLNTKDDEVLLSLNGYYSPEIKDMTDDEIKSKAIAIRQQEDDEVRKLSDDKAVMKYYHDKYEHDYLSDSINESKQVAKWFKDKFNVDGLLFFSGGKGSHLHILLNNPVDVKNVQEVNRHIGDTLKKHLKLKTIDSNVYNDKVRVIRMPTSRHQETKLYANQFMIDDRYIDIIDNAMYRTSLSDIVIPDNDTSKLESFIKEIDDKITTSKNNKAVRNEIKEDAQYSINHDVPIYDDVDFKDKFLKVYKKGQMNPIGHRLVHLLYRSGMDIDDVRQFFINLQIDQDLNKVDSWIDRTYKLKIGNDHVGGLNYFLDGVNEYASDDDKESLLSYFKGYFTKQDKIEYKDLKSFRIGRDDYHSKVTAKLVNGLITEIAIHDLIKKESGFNFILDLNRTAKFNVILNDESHDFIVNYKFNESGFNFKNIKDLSDIETMLTDEYVVPKWPKSLINNLKVYLSDLYDYIIEVNKPDETEILISSVLSNPTDTKTLIRLSEFIEDELSIKRTSDKKNPFYYLNNNPNDFNSPTMDILNTSSLGYILLRDYNIRLPDKNVETVLSSIKGQHKVNTTSWEFKDGYYLETDKNYQILKADPKITSKKAGIKIDDKFIFYEYKPDVKFFNMPEDETLTEKTLKQILIPKTAKTTVKKADDGHEYIVYDNPDDYKLYLDYLQRIGASFSQNNRHKKVTMYLGTGDNGKSLLSHILHLIFDKHYYGFTPKQLKTDNFTDSMASGKNALVIDELTKDSLNGLWDIIKRYSSGLDNTTKRTMYSDETDDISSYGLLYVFTNVIPDMPTDDKAILRRVDILTLPNVFTDNPTADNEYPIINGIDLKLKHDVQGLEWLVNASIKAYKYDYRFKCSQSDIETLSIVKETDNLFNYLYKNTELNNGSQTYVSQLLDGFKEWSDEQGHLINMTDKELRKEIGKKVRQIYSPDELQTNPKGKRWYNIRIKSKDEIKKELSKKWTINEHIQYPEEWQVSGMDRNVLNFIKENPAVTIDDIKSQYPKTDVESILKGLIDEGYVIKYELT